MNRARLCTRNVLDKRPMRRGKRNARCYARPSSSSPESRSSVLVPKTMINLQRLRSPMSPRLPRSLNLNPRSRPRPRPRSPRRQPPCPVQLLLRARWRRPMPSPFLARATHRAGLAGATCSSKNARSPVPDRSTVPPERRATRSLACVCREPHRNKSQYDELPPGPSLGYLNLRSFAASTRKLMENP